MKSNLVKPAFLALFAVLVVGAVNLLLNQTGQAQRLEVSGFGIAPPTLGVYSAATVTSGGSTTVTPSAVPTNTIRITAQTSANFKGVLSVNPASGVVRVTGAAGVGVYNVTVTAFNTGIPTATATFSLRVLGSSGCSPFTAAGNFTQTGASPFAVGSSPQFPVFGDFNNDGIADFATANFVSNNVSVALGTGAGVFGATVNIATAGTNPQTVAIGDFNGDGNQDIVAGNGISNSYAVLLGNGAGGFTQGIGSPFPSGGTGVRGVVVADFNGDGRSDIAIVNGASNSVSIALGDGTGSFTGAIGSPFAVGGQPFGIVKGFFNADAFVDLAVVNTTSNNLSILLGDGTGGFTASATPTINVGPRTVAVADFNNDGFQDLAVDSLDSTNLSLLLGNGTGSFTVGASIAAGVSTLGITTADFNGDGNADLLASQFANPGGPLGAVLLQLGSGAGTFGFAGAIGGLANPRGFAIADLNGDARPDFVVNESDGDRFRSYLAACTLNITTNALPNGIQLQPYNFNINATGGTMPYSYGSSGLPAGMTINQATGAIFGTPTVAGTFTPQIVVIDSTPFAPRNEGSELTPSTQQATSKSFQLIIHPQVAAGVSVGGRVLTPDGRGLANATVYLRNQLGEISQIRTSSLGYYRFDDILAGQTITVSIAAKRYQFTPRVVSVTDEIVSLDFVAED